MEHKNRSITRVTTMNKGRRKKCLEKENRKIKKKEKTKERIVKKERKRNGTFRHSEHSLKKF